MSSSFFNTPKIATEDDCKLRWSCGKPGEFFRCSLCGHKLIPGDEYTIVYTNDMPEAPGNPICCTKHGAVHELREQWSVRSVEFKEFSNDKFWFFHKHSFIMTLEKLNFHLLTTLGLSHDSAEAVIDRITELESNLNDRDETIKNLEARVYDLRAQFIAADHHRCVLRTAAEALCDAWHDEQAQSSNIEPLVDALDSAVRITPMGDDARHQVETKLKDALVELHRYKCIERGETPPP